MRLRRGIRLFAAAGGRWSLVASAAPVLIGGVVPVAAPALSKHIVNRLTAGSSTTLWLLVAGYAATLVVPSLLQPIRQVLASAMEDRLVGEIDRRLIDAGRALPDLTRIEQTEFHDRVQQSKRTSVWVPRLVSTGQTLGGSVITVIGLLVVLGRLQPWIPLAFASTALPHLLLQRRHNHHRLQALADRAPAAREMDYCARVSLEPDSGREVRVFGLGDYFLARFQRHLGAAYQQLDRLRLRTLWQSALLTLLHAAVVGGGFYYVADRVGSGALSIGDIALYLSAIVQLETTMVLLTYQASSVHQAGLHLGRLFDLVDGATPGIDLTTSTAPAPARLRTGVQLRGVSFGYPASDAPVLREVDAHLPAGRITAVVGENGAGKSTLVKLLTRMYDPDSGAILLDGAPLQSYDLAALRRTISVVYQDFAHFSLTLRDNIAVGDLDSDLDPAVAAARSGADAVAARLPDGYDTMLTRRFDGGIEPSGGEWQKIATARAFLRDAALVILDEPTSALDAGAEAHLFGQFQDIMRGRTGLLISHRFSTVRMADHIIVLSDGSVVEAGSHRELIALGGRYAEMFEMQAGRYR